jgi:hypothetical protein
VCVCVCVEGNEKSASKLTEQREVYENTIRKKKKAALKGCTAVLLNRTGNRAKAEYKKGEKESEADRTATASINCSRDIAWGGGGGK